MNNKLILRLFNGALPSKSEISFEDMNKFAVEYGYVVHPDVCTQDVKDFIKSNHIDFNSTFYKTWSDIISKNRFELFIDQIRHYASTYGTDFQGDVWLPEGKAEDLDFTKFKVILPLSEEEVIKRCEDMLFSGIALKEETSNDVITILGDLNYLSVLDLEKIKNKEAKLKLCAKLNRTPKDPVEMVRFLCYLVTDKSLLIKDSATIKTIRDSRINITNYLEEFGLERLSSVFYRYKNIFLAFKTNVANGPAINKLRKLAVKNHVPMTVGFFESILSSPHNVFSLQKRLPEITNFKKVLLLQAISVRLKELDVRAFSIRNGKIFIKDGVRKADKYLTVVYDIIYKDLVESMKKKACKIKLPAGINLTIPTSEKSFVGNYPLGSSIDLSDSDAVVGINWRDVDGADDLDLSLTEIDGTKYGWNSVFKNSSNSVVFSGDMTSADPQATELFYASSGFSPCIVKVNLFRGDANSGFKFFVAKQKFTDLSRNPMVDKNCVVAQADMKMDAREKILGVITENKFILAEFKSGSSAVSRGRGNATNYTDYAMKTIDCYVHMESVLTAAGFTVTDQEPDVDLTDLSKDTLINLFS